MTGLITRSDYVLAAILAHMRQSQLGVVSSAEEGVLTERHLAKRPKSPPLSRATLHDS
jgi:hypothetical protein